MCVCMCVFVGVRMLPAVHKLLRGEKTAVHTNHYCSSAAATQPLIYSTAWFGWVEASPAHTHTLLIIQPDSRGGVRANVVAVVVICAQVNVFEPNTLDSSPLQSVFCTRFFTAGSERRCPAGPALPQHYGPSCTPVNYLRRLPCHV